MRTDESRAQFESILAEYRKLQAELAAGHKRQDVLYKLLRGYMDLFPEFQDLMAPAHRSSTKSGEQAPPLGRPPSMVVPRGQEAVRRVLEDAPGRWFTVTGMVDELRARSWLPETGAPAPAVRTALERLASQDDSPIRKDKGKKTGAVTYCLRQGTGVKSD